MATNNPDDTGDDIPFEIPGANGARLWQPDTSLMKFTQHEHTLLARDGTRPTQIISSVRPPSGQIAAANCDNSRLATTVHAWLGAHALRGIPGRYDQAANDIT